MKRAAGASRALLDSDPRQPEVCCDLPQLWRPTDTLGRQDGFVCDAFAEHPDDVLFEEVLVRAGETVDAPRRPFAPMDLRRWSRNESKAFPRGKGAGIVRSVEPAGVIERVMAEAGAAVAKLSQ
jgi:hypothetical protein